MIQDKPLHPRLGAQFIEFFDRGGHVPDADICPSLDQSVHPRADAPGVGVLIQQTLVVFGLRHACRRHQICHLTGLFPAGDDPRQGQSFVYVAQGEISQNRAFLEFDIIWLFGQRFSVISRGLGKIASHRCVTSGQVRPRYGICRNRDSHAQAQSESTYEGTVFTEHCGSPHFALVIKLSVSMPSAMVPI